jgi:hypothetical protein
MATATATVMVKAKRGCCSSKPRCKRCPVVLRRLEAEGYALRVTKRRFEVEAKVPKKVLRRARKRSGAFG